MTPLISEILSGFLASFPLVKNKKLLVAYKDPLQTKITCKQVLNASIVLLKRTQQKKLVCVLMRLLFVFGHPCMRRKYLLHFHQPILLLGNN